MHHHYAIDSTFDFRERESEDSAVKFSVVKLLLSSLNHCRTLVPEVPRQIFDLERVSEESAVKFSVLGRFLILFISKNLALH